MEPDHFAERQAAPAKGRRGRWPAYDQPAYTKSRHPLNGTRPLNGARRLIGARSPAKNLGNRPPPEASGRGGNC